MGVLPEAQLEAYESAGDREAAWEPLADWMLEARPNLVGQRPPRLEPLSCEFEFVAQLARRAYLNWVDSRRTKQFELEPLLRDDACALVDELSLSSVWPGTPAMVFGSAPQRMTPPAALLPALIDAAIASAPVLLRRLEVWIPKNPPWGPADDCRTQLEPLTRQRPRLAQQLVVRAPRKGLVEFVRQAADNRWRTITLAAPLTAEDVSHLRATAAHFPHVFIQLIDETRRDALSPNLAFVRDPDACTIEVTVGGRTTKGTTAPGRRIDVELDQALLSLGLEFVTDLGMNALVPRASVPRGQISLNSRVLLEPFFLRDGLVEIVWTQREGERHGHVRRVVG